MKVFFDTNIILDVLRNREPFVQHSQAVWLLAEQGRIVGQVSALSFASIFYIARRFTDTGTAQDLLRQLRAVFQPVACDATVIDQSLASDFPDFEDAVQYFSARNAAADCIVTRDAKHFRNATIPVLSPEQFLTAHDFGSTSP